METRLEGERNKATNDIVCEVIRSKYTDDTTIGRWHFPNEDYCWTLEDTVRAHGIKVSGHTALSEGMYRLSTRYSPSFKRDLAVIYTEDDKVTSKMGGISFKYALVHAGATHQNTEACILVSNQYDNNERITPTRLCEQEIMNRIKSWEDQGLNVWLKISNSPQSS